MRLDDSWGAVLFDASPDLNTLPIDDSRIVCVGAHSDAPRFFSTREISFEGINSVCDSVMAAVKDFPNLFVLVSGRVLDRAFCERGIPGGLSTRELMYFLYRISLLNNCRRVEFVDVDDALRQKLSSSLAKPL